MKRVESPVCGKKVSLIICLAAAYAHIVTANAIHPNEFTMKISKLESSTTIKTEN